jgi:hypothetical protein
MKTQPMADSCPNYLNVPSHMPLAYPPGFGSLAMFDCQSMGDKLSYGSSEFRGKHTVVLKSEQQTVTLDRP